MRLLLSMVLGLTVCGAADAKDKEDTPHLRKLVECVPGKQMAKLSDAIAGLDADRLDTINTNPSFTLKPNDGGPAPQRVFVRLGEMETDLKMIEDGEVVDFMPVFAGQKDAELCVADPVRAGQPYVQGGAYSFSMAFNMNYINSSGRYEMDELSDGLKDGKAALKKMIGGPVALVLPKLSHIYVEYEDEAAEPVFKAQRKGKDVGTPEFTKLGDAYLIDYKSLKALKADTLIVEGGVHTLSPSMSPKRMAKLMGADDYEESSKE